MLHVSAATEAERDAACRLLVSFRPPTERDRTIGRYRELFTSGDLDPAGLFAARAYDGSIRGAMLASAMPGALGLAWPPSTLRGSDRQAVEDALVAAACGWLRAQGVKVCQALGGKGDRESFAPLQRAGFVNLTRLIEFRGELNDEPFPTTSLTFERIENANGAAFGSALLATFTGSLDCPEVSGSRSDAELIATYTESAQLGTVWFLAKQHDEAAGVVLLEPAGDPLAWELSYLGIVPQFRRRGFGAELLAFARHSARKTGGSALKLSVDARNLPARRLYETRGFQAFGERFVFLANWPPAS